eukprot:412669_1
MSTEFQQQLPDLNQQFVDPMNLQSFPTVDITTATVETINNTINKTINNTNNTSLVGSNGLTQEQTKIAREGFLPEISKCTYYKEYSKFDDWFKSKEISVISQDVMMLFCKEQRLKYAPSTIFKTISCCKKIFMLKGIDIKSWKNVVSKTMMENIDKNDEMK